MHVVRTFGILVCFIFEFMALIVLYLTLHFTRMYQVTNTVKFTRDPMVVGFTTVCAISAHQH
jgi:hypothetical protein